MLPQYQDPERPDDEEGEEGDGEEGEELLYDEDKDDIEELLDGGLLEDGWEIWNIPGSHKHTNWKYAVFRVEKINSTRIHIAVGSKVVPKTFIICPEPSLLDSKYFQFILRISAEIISKDSEPVPIENLRHNSGEEADSLLTNSAEATDSQEKENLEVFFLIYMKVTLCNTRIE